jgi:protein involved in polysaccharide export with SLBB domain
LPQGTGLQQTGPYAVRPGNTNSSNYSDIEQWWRQQTAQNEAQQALLPHEPLTEFQKFVASSTGQVLPIYAAGLFRRAPSTFAALEMTPVPADYVVGPGDEVRIRIWGQVNLQANLRVDRSGDIYIPQVGPVHLAGLAVSTLDAHLRQALGRIYRNFDLTVDIGQIRAIQVYVAGAARVPGVYTVSSLSTLVDALFVSGGPTVEGSLRSIEVRRGAELVTRFDLYGLLIRGDKSKDVKLQSGDVIFIPPVGAQAAVTGSVRNPGIYELLPQEPLSGLLADAGGASALAAEARISIERTDEHRKRQAMEAAYDAAGLAVPLADGDLVRVYSIVPAYSKTVTLRGNIANPGHFAWSQGMHVSDLIPDKESLITRNYWWRRAQLGLPAPEFEPTQGIAEMRQPTENSPVTIPLSQRQSSTELQPPGTQENQGGSAQNQSNSAQDQYAASSQQGQRPSAEQRPGSNALASTVTAPTGRLPYSSERTEVQLLAPEINWNQAIIERLDPETLKTTLIPFDLGRLVLQHDASQDLELAAGDVVTIFSEADIRVPIAQQTKLVHLDGEFAHSGVYTAKPGETLRQLAERAGGLTPNAYLYGSEFTRESTRSIQQARIDEYVQSLSMRIQRDALGLAASPASSAQDLASGAAAQPGERDLLASLRQIRATGRIVLRFQPGSSGTASLPDIVLENGDNFVVPPVPAVVNVVGAVYDQNSFVYIEGRRVEAYLRLAGGPTRDADRRHEFVIRADGQVTSRDASNGLWGNQFEQLHISPGDTIVVPEKTLRSSALRGIVDWSQMFSQFALGAAALSVLK